MKIKPSRNGEITLSFTDEGKSFSGREFLASQICIISPFAKIKLTQKIVNILYILVL